MSPIAICLVDAVACVSFHIFTISLEPACISAVHARAYLPCICSARSRNLRNPRIALRNLGILTLARNPRIAHRIPALRTFLREAGICTKQS